MANFNPAHLVPKTIRGQIVMAFLVCFVFMGAIIAVNYNSFRRLSRSMVFFELAEDLNSAILEMRRYEKNYFLYRQDFNYEENVSYTNQLGLTLEREKANLIEAIGRENYTNFTRNVAKYASLMTRYRQPSCDANRCDDLQTLIRGTGQNLLILADQLVVTEQRAIDRLLKQMIPLPLISLMVLLILLGFVVFFIGEKVVRPLARITRESGLAATGAIRRITPHGDAKNEIHHLVAAINSMLTELETRQEQLIQSRKIASVGTLTAGIAHEINNPVNNLSLILESLLEDADEMDEAERRKLYEDAMDQADRTSDIVKNLLEFSRASHGRAEFVNLEAVVAKTARLINNELNAHAIEFIKEIAPDCPDAYLDKGGLQQVLLNLFMNAVQAMGQNGRLAVAIGPSETPEEIRIDVRDSGPGIPADQLGQIFDPFFTSRKEGVGLGLSVSYNIIRKNGGRMEVNSRPGEGACFSIFLPTRRTAYGDD